MFETLASTKVAERASPRRIAQGDVAALSQWFCDHKDPLYAFIFYRVNGDVDLASDATQATFTEALERIAEFDPERGDMRTWLRYLSRNIIRSTLAEHRRGEQLQFAWDNLDQSLQAAYERMDCELLPDEVLERKETREMVSVTLSNLPPKYRDVLEEKYIDGQSLVAIAESRDTTVDSVKAMLRRARSSFRECFLAISLMNEPEIGVSDV